MKLNIQLFASGTINGSSTASNCDCRITWTSTGDTSTNSSSVTANVQIYRSGSSSTTGTFSGSLTINGTKYSISKKFSPYNWGSWATVGSKTVTIEHDSDGTKTIPIKCSLTQTGTSMAGTYSASGNATLDTLHKAPTINSITMQEVNPTLVQAGISNNYFVLGLSQKQFTINATYEDSATYDHTTIANVYTLRLQYDNPKLKNIDVLTSTNNILDTKTTEILPYYTNFFTSNVRLFYDVYDSMGASTSYRYNNYYPFEYDYQTYTPITLTANVKRVGQTSGNVKITASGTYYNGTIGNENHSGTYKPTLIYKYWEAGQDETQATIVTIPSSSITISSNTFNCEYQISGFDYEKAYRFKVAVQDTLVNNNSMWFSSASTNELSVAVGKALWTEYKDRVDFDEITKKGEKILVPYTLFENDSGTTSTITLSETSANFDYLEFFYMTNDGNYGSTKVYSPNGKTISLNANHDNGTYTYVKTALVLVNGTSVTFSRIAQTRIGNNVATTHSTGTGILVTRVVGYK